MGAGLAIAAAAAGVAAAPHCAGMCGPVAAFACRDRAASVSYHLARLAGYASAGAFVGWLGAAAVGWLRAPIAQALLSWSLAAGLGLAAWRLWRSRRPQAALVQLRRKKPTRWQPPLLGLATTLLPCGALAAGLMLAAGTGGALSGAMAMASFAVGSSLGLIGAGAIAVRLRYAGEAPRKVLAVALALGALVLALRPIGGLRGRPACHAAASPVGQP